MAGISDIYEERILNAVLRNEPLNAPGQVYLALFLDDPTDAGTGTEVNGGDYERQPVTFTAATQVSGKGTVYNSASVSFPVATSDWGTVTHIGLYDAQSGGNLIWHGHLTTPREVMEDDMVNFPVENVIVDLD